jgi:2-(1,2-epoxy-1,2-dihydrophenyl)acetyl-CoA isomerase
MTSTPGRDGPSILLEPVGDAVRVILNRPEQLNALSAQMLLDLAAALGRSVADGARAVLITGAGRAFCSGAMIEKGAADDVNIQTQFDRYYNHLARTLSELPVPIVTAVNGAAAGGGAAIALAGDIVLAARSSYLMLAFAKIALVPDMGATWLVARAAGRLRALEMALLGERLPAEEAYRVGLVTQVVADDELPARAGEVCARLAGMPTRTLALIRRQVRLALESTFDASLEVEKEHQALCTRTEDFKEGVASFIDKRPAVYRGE